MLDIRPVVLDDNVGGLHQPEEHISTLLLLEVERERTFVAMQVSQVEIGQALAKAPIGPRDLNDVCAQVSEDPDARGPGARSAEIDHRQVAERALASGSVL